MGLDCRRRARGGNSLVCPPVSQSLRAVAQHLEERRRARPLPDAYAGDLLRRDKIDCANATSVNGPHRARPDLAGCSDATAEAKSNRAASSSEPGVANLPETSSIAASRRIARHAERAGAEKISK